MADRCEDLMGKYELMLRRTTQVEMSVGILRSRFETYPPQQFDLTDVLDTPITLGNHVVASGPRTLEERIELGRDWEQWLASVEDVEEEERLVAEAKETAKAWVDSVMIFAGFLPFSFKVPSTVMIFAGFLPFFFLSPKHPLISFNFAQP